MSTGGWITIQGNSGTVFLQRSRSPPGSHIRAGGPGSPTTDWEAKSKCRFWSGIWILPPARAQGQSGFKLLLPESFHVCAPLFTVCHAGCCEIERAPCRQIREERTLKHNNVSESSRVPDREALVRREACSGCCFWNHTRLLLPPVCKETYRQSVCHTPKPGTVSAQGRTAASGVCF